MNRTYCLFDIRSIDDGQRIIEGIATTSEEALDGLILETRGIEFALPVPFLYAHDMTQPIGNVISAEVQNDKITVRIQIAKEGIAGFIDERWRMIKAGIVRGLSIRWKTLKSKGNRITKSRWIELSAVATPADLNATITSIRAADEKILAALGTKESRSVVRLTSQPAGVTAKSQGKSMKTTPEKIAALEAKRAANTARIAEISEKAVGEESRTFEPGETEEIGNLRNEVRSIDETLVILRDVEKDNIARAVAVTEKTVETEHNAVATRQSHVVTVKSMAPKGIGFARMALAVANGAMTYQNPADVARRRWPDSPEVEQYLRTAIEAGDTTTSGWASQLVPAAQQMENEFLEVLRAQTIIGRLPLNPAPFNIAVPIETASGTVAWVGEGAPKPVGKLTLDSVTLRWAKAAGIVGITQELAKFSRPDAELLVRNSMTKTLVRFFDSHFVSTTAEVSNVSPAGILNGKSAIGATPSGTNAAAFRSDFAKLLAAFTANNVPLDSIYILMSSTQAVNLSLMVTDLGIQLFPGISREGGTILGFPVVISEAVGTKIIALSTNEIFLASDPGVQIDVSREASVEMSDTPILGDTSPITGAVYKSAFQNNLIFIRVEQFITWKRARTTAVEWISGNAYVA